MNLKILVSALLASARAALAAQALRGEDQGQGRDPAPEAVRGDGGRVRDEGHGARALTALQADSEGQRELSGFCRDSEGRVYDRITFTGLSHHYACLLACPTEGTELVGYEYPDSREGADRDCHCRYEAGHVMGKGFHCPEGAECAVVPNIWGPNTNLSGEGQVESGSNGVGAWGDVDYVCRTPLTDAGLDALRRIETWVNDIVVNDITIENIQDLAEGTGLDPSALTVYTRGFRTNFGCFFCFQAAVPDHVSGWDVSRGTYFVDMFQSSAFAGDLSSWRITVPDEGRVSGMFANSGMTNPNHCPGIQVGGENNFQRWCPGKDWGEVRIPMGAGCTGMDGGEVS